MNILEELWYGQICPVANEDYRNPEYLELTDLLVRNKEKLLPTLNPQQQADLKKMEDIWEDLERISQCSAFATGFRLAMQLMAASV